MATKKMIWVLIMTAGVMSQNVCANGSINIIPKPHQAELQPGGFTLDKKVLIVSAESGNDDLVGYLSAAITQQTAVKLATKRKAPWFGRTITLISDGSESDLGQEGYELTVTKNKVTIRAPKSAGLFYGVQSLLQLIPLGDADPYEIPCVKIKDQPRFRWRGMMLDSGRHFMPPEFVKKFIDLLAMHKMNIFHWHLTEDQGWRIEIKKYPKLTEVSAWRKETVIGRNSGHYDGKRYGGFYTQDEIKEIVEYAKQRHVTIVPEIEMPGHCRAALAAYPELSCTGGPFEVKTNWGVEQEVYCAGNEKVFEFLENVLNEVIQLFPSEFIHIGGDECPKERWKRCDKCQARIKAEGLGNEHELQSWFVKRIEKYLNTHGRRLIGWDEILEGGLAPNAAVMSWRGEKGGIAAAQSGHDVVMAPNSHTYFDHYQAQPEKEPLAIGGFLPLEKVYAYNPAPDVLSDTQQHHILGVQAQLWSEYIPTPEHAEYMAYPRGCALAEVAWTPLAEKNYDDFYDRLKVHLMRLEALDVDFRKLGSRQEIIGQWNSGQVSQEYQPFNWDITDHLDGPGTYQFMFRYTGGKHRLDIQSAEVLEDGAVIAKDVHSAMTGSRNEKNTYMIHIPEVKEKAKYLLRAIIRSDGGTDSNGSVYLTKN